MQKTFKTKAMDSLQKLVRLESTDDNGYCQCVSCGSFFHWKKGDGGHFIPKSHSSYWALRKENVHPQCKSCNGFGMRFGTAAQRYTLWMQDKYGRDFVESMETNKRRPIKLYKKDYLKMKQEWDEKIKAHLERISYKTLIRSEQGDFRNTQAAPLKKERECE